MLKVVDRFDPSATKGKLGSLELCQRGRIGIDSRNKILRSGDAGPGEAGKSRVEVGYVDDVAQMSLAEMGGGITGFGEDLGNRNLGTGQSGHFMWHADFPHPAAYWVSTGQKRDACGRARWLRVHPCEVDAFSCHPVEIWRREPEILLQRGKTDSAKRHIVPKYVDNIWRHAVFLPKRSELLVNFAVFDGPFLSVLSFKNVVLSIVDDLAVLWLSYGNSAAHREK